MRVAFFFLVAASASCGLCEASLTTSSLSAATPRCQQLAFAAAAFRLLPALWGRRAVFMVRSLDLFPCRCGHLRIAGRVFRPVSSPKLLFQAENNAIPVFRRVSMSPKSPYTLFYLRNCYQRPRLLCCTRCGIQNQSASHPFTLRCV